MKSVASVVVLVGLASWLFAEEATPAWVSERFQQLDKDQNNKLTKDEIGSALFEVLNQNADEHVTLDEARESIRKRGLAAVLKAANAPKEAPKAEPLPVESVRQGPKRLPAADHLVDRLIPNMTLTDINGNKQRLSDLQKQRTIVIAFTNTSCPISKKYLPTLAALEKKYREQQVEFVFVNPTASDKADAIRSVIEANKLSGSYIRDLDGMISQSLAATHTTDCFVLDAKRTLIYRGAVDDQYGFGYSLEEPRTTFLVDALDAVLAKSTPRIAATEAPGCPLEFKNDAPSAAVTAITYHNRVSRIIQSHCQECHRDGGVAPFSLGSFDEVAGQSGAIRRVIEQNLMPPWFAARPEKGTASPFANDCSLADADRADLLAWLKGGKPVGDPQDAPLPRSFVAGWQIGQPDLVLQLPQPIAIKASGTMPYQNVVIETGLTEDKYIQAVEVKPTAREVVHHVLVFVIPPGKRGEKTPARTEGDDETDGTDGFFAAYAPGYDALVFNEGYGKVIPAGSRLKFQIHYTPNGTATQDQSQVGLIFADKRPEHLVNVAGLAQPRLSIPPGADNFEVSTTRPIPVDTSVLAFFPHMHLRGKAFRYEVTLPNGKTETLLDIPRYDFNWQLSYRFAEPVTLPAGSTLKVTAWYDNSKNNPANPDPTRTVRWGPQTYDEMMIGYVEYHAASGSLNRERFNIEALFKVMDKNKDGKLTENELHPFRPEGDREGQRGQRGERGQRGGRPGGPEGPGRPDGPPPPPRGGDGDEGPGRRGTPPPPPPGGGDE